MISMVNGYVCRDCSDEVLAKRGIDPLHPKDGAHRSRAVGAAQGEQTGAVSPPVIGVNQPNPAADMGRSLNVLG